MAHFLENLNPMWLYFGQTHRLPSTVYAEIQDQKNPGAKGENQQALLLLRLHLCMNFLR